MEYQTKPLLCLLKKYFGKKNHGSQYYSIEFLSAMACRKFADTLRNAGVLSEKSSGMSHLSHLPPSLLPSFQEMVRILLKSHICGNSALFGNFPRKEMKDWVFFQSTGGYDQGHARLWESKLTIGKTMPRIISREWGGRSRTSGWQLLRMGGGAGLMGGGWTLGGGRDFSR